ncbi:MAG TPA: septum formation initiator family protein [Ktedonobacteraceae bacterium]|nr:septum formation initiator family protein [Ktedonobacteraceae bacterium]
MYGLKEREDIAQSVPRRAPLVARRRRQLYPFFFHMGPVALCITSVLLIGLMAVLYLSQVSQGVSANQQLQTINAQQAAQKRQNQDLVNIIAQEQSPAYIAAGAHKLGLVPAGPASVQVLVVKHLLPVANNQQSFQP